MKASATREWHRINWATCIFLVPVLRWPTILLDRQLTKPWDAFVEYAGDFPEVGKPRHWLHFGTALKVAKQHQIDFHVGVGLSSAAVDHLIGVGYSFRFQAIAR